MGTAAVVRCNATGVNGASYLWDVLDAGNDQMRSVGLVAYGRTGSRLRIKNRGTSRCLGFYPDPFIGKTVRALPCSRTAIAQQWTLVRITLP